MNTKLTLNVDESVIKKAKVYARKNKVSLSKLIEAYLASLTHNPKQEDVEVSPLVKSLSGIIELEDDFDYRKSYTGHLADKYK